MKVSAGTILISSPGLDGSELEKVVVFITEHNEKGTTGFVINKLFSRVLNELVEFKNSKAFPLYDGGVVEKENLYFIHQRPELINNSTHIIGSIYFGGDFTQTVNCIDNGTITEKDIKLFIGYCGWDEDQLEEEIAEGSWLIVDTIPQNIFDGPNEIVWDHIFQAINSL